MFQGEAPNPGKTLCDKCSAGKYQPDSGGAACLECDEGTFSNRDGSIEYHNY